MRNFLLDTNVISESTRTTPHPTVAAFLKDLPSTASYLSALTLGEIRKGIEQHPDPSRKFRLTQWFETCVLQQFKHRILSIDTHVADRWGRLCAEIKRPLPGIDSLLAATAFHWDMTLVTRNTKDFDIPGLKLLNPWTLS